METIESLHTLESELNNSTKINAALSIMIEICNTAHLRKPKIHDGKIEVYGSFDSEGDPITFLHALNSDKWKDQCFDHIDVIICNFMIDINDINATRDLWDVYWFQTYFSGRVTFRRCYLETNRYLETQGLYQWVGEFSMEWFNTKIATLRKDLRKIIMESTYKDELPNNTIRTIIDNENNNKGILVAINTGCPDRLITWNYGKYHICCVSWLFE